MLLDRRLLISNLCYERTPIQTSILSNSSAWSFGTRQKALILILTYLTLNSLHAAPTESHGAEQAYNGLLDHMDMGWTRIILCFFKENYTVFS